MTYGIKYLTVDGWRHDHTGTYDTLEDATAALRVAEVVFPGVSHVVVKQPDAPDPSGRRATTGRLSGARRSAYRG